jgi:DNA-binding SARP family transcriptional activator
MRTNAGGPFFLGYHYAVKGAVLAILGHYGEAGDNLDRALQFAEQIPSPFIRICALAYLCYAHIEEKNEYSIEPLLREWLELMIKTGFDYFWGWESGCMLTILTEAVRRGIEPEFANRLAEQRLGTSIILEQEAVPIIQVRTLGRFSIGIESTELFTIQDFSSHQREFFGLLISSPDLRISQDQVQLALWPDSPPDKASKTFYTLISRLRKALAQKLPDPTSYISVEKNFVQLVNARVDSVHFLDCARSGLNFARRELWWQAGNAFYDALSCWNSFSNSEYFFTEQSLAYTDEIISTLRKICLTWATALEHFNQLDEAIALLEKTGRILLADEEIVSFQYQLYTKKKNPLKARTLLDNYKQELLGIGYTAEEAEEIKRELFLG